HGASPLQISAQLDDLASESYARRNAAMTQLIEAGSPAIDLILQKIRNSSEAEVQIRGLDVLKILADREIAERNSPAVNALETLARSDDPVLARRANTRLDGVAQQRRDFAVKRLQELGAKVDGDSWRQKILVGRGMITQRIDLDSNLWHGTEEDAQLIAELGDVGEVRLTGPQITDDYLEPLTKLTGLVYVYLSRTSVTDEGIAKLKACPDLAKVVLRYMDLTDATIGSLAEMNVHSVEIIGTDITLQAVEGLREQVPGIKVEYKAGAYLGVGADILGTNDQGCRLNRIEPDSAAAKAGLMVDDIVVSYDGKEITDFESLRNLIAVNRPGDVVSVEWLRGKKSFKADVTLGAWP
ncbi:MAG: PDZ domain-containing protein, partial [Planctomycetota bacterium]